jgi:hypothetical protein
MSEYEAQAKERWPNFNKSERSKCATILRRLDHLRKDKEQRHNLNNYWINAEIAALEWALRQIDTTHEGHGS